MVASKVFEVREQLEATNDDLGFFTKTNDGVHDSKMVSRCQVWIKRLRYYSTSLEFSEVRKRVREGMQRALLFRIN